MTLIDKKEAEISLSFSNVKGKKEALKIIRGLKEYSDHRKVKIPKDLADYIEDHEKGKTAAELIFDIWDNGTEDNLINAWISENKDIFVRALMDGYEVDDVRYYVMVPYALGWYYTLENGRIKALTNKNSAYKFDVYELKKYFSDIDEMYLSYVGKADDEVKNENCKFCT